MSNSLKHYINESKRNVELEKELIKLSLPNLEFNINEHIFNGKTNGRTWWGDIKHYLGKLFTGIGAFLGITGVAITAGIKKFWDTVTEDDEEKKKERLRSGYNPFIDSSDEEIDNKKKKIENILNDLSLVPIDYPHLEKIIDLYGDTVYGNDFEFISDAINDWTTKQKEKPNDLFCTAIMLKKKTTIGFVILSKKETFEKNFHTYIAIGLSKSAIKNSSDDLNSKILKYVMYNIKESHVKAKKNDETTKLKGYYINIDNDLPESAMKSFNCEYISKQKYWKFILEDGPKKYKDEEDENKKQKTTNESLDEENILWKIDKWFEYKETDKQLFFELISKYNQTVDVKELKQDIENTNFKFELKEFVNFIFDDFDFSTEKDYLYQLKKIIEFVKSKK